MVLRKRTIILYEKISNFDFLWENYDTMEKIMVLYKTRVNHSKLNFTVIF